MVEVEEDYLIIQLQEPKVLLELLAVEQHGMMLVDLETKFFSTPTLETVEVGIQLETLKVADLVDCFSSIIQEVNYGKIYNFYKQ
jgi:hypothetical protein